MPALPSGTVTLLFTDVEGSTQLQRRLGERYAQVIDVHHRMLREAFESHGGHVVDSQADSFFCAFPRVKDAVAAAADAQRALAAHDWSDGVEVRVRMGIHAGQPEIVGDRYLGLPVVRGARICDTAHGGQVLLSRLARDLLRDHEPIDVMLRDLGAYRLKDFDAPEPLAQLVIDGLPARFPPPRMTEPPPPRRRRLLLAGGLAVAAAIAAAATLLLSSGGSGSLTKIGPTSMGVIDPKSNELVDEIPLGFTSGLIAAGEGFVWVVDPQGSTLVKIDPRRREKVEPALGLGAGLVPFGLAVHKGIVWITGLRGDDQVLLEISAEHGGLRRGKTVELGTAAVAGLSNQRALAVGGDTLWLYVPARGGLSRLDPDTGRAEPVVEGLAGAALAAGPSAVWLVDQGELTKVEASTGKTFATQVGQPWTSAGSVAVGEDTVWYADSSSTAVRRIDPESTKVTGTATVGRGPTGIAVGEGGVWVSASDGTVTRLDRKGRRIATISLGAPPAAIVSAYGAVWTSPGEPLA